MVSSCFLSSVQSDGYKALYGPGPGYLKDCLTLQISSWPLRFLGERLVHVPLLSDTRLAGTTEGPSTLLHPSSGTSSR